VKYYYFSHFRWLTNCLSTAPVGPRRFPIYYVLSMYTNPFLSFSFSFFGTFFYFIFIFIILPLAPVLSHLYESTQTLSDPLHIYSFISALLSGHAKGPTLFRSWSNADQDHSTIVQAAWATTRAPLFFNAVEHNNPVKYVVEEANSLFPGRPISCVLSLGTGTAEVIGLKQPDAFQSVLPQNLIGLLKDIAEECERQSNAMEA